MLFEYQQQVQRLVDDAATRRHNPFDLTYYINKARARIASETQCVRVLPPSSGSLLGATVVSAGAGYLASDPVTIGGPDAVGVGFSTARASINLGQLLFANLSFTDLIFGGTEIAGLTISNPGAGYSALPPISIKSETGSGAILSPILSPRLTTQPQVEVYRFGDVVSLIADQGVKSIIGVQSVSVSWGSERPVLRRTDWSAFQAYLRASNIGAQSWPTVWSQYGQGVNGSIYLWPVPFQQMEMQWDCYCLPLDLVDDTTPEAIPYPWVDSVPYYAAFMAFQAAQDRDAATYMLAEAKRTMREGRAFSTPAVVPDFY